MSVVFGMKISSKHYQAILIVSAFVISTFFFTSAAFAEGDYFSNRVLRGHDLSADGAKLVIALSDDGAGSNPQIMLSDDASFTSFRTLDLPVGYVWFHPVFSPDASHIAVSGYCLDRTLCSNGDIYNIYEIDLQTDTIERISSAQPDFLQIEPAYAEDGQIYYLQTEDRGRYTSSRSGGDSLIVTRSSTGETENVFPVDHEIISPKEDNFLSPPEVAFRFGKILDVRADQLVFLSAAASEYDVLNPRLSPMRSTLPSDPRMVRLHKEIVMEMRRISGDERWHIDLSSRLYSVTDESINILSDDLPVRQSITHHGIHSADRLGPGRYILTMSQHGEAEKFFIYENGITTFLMDMPDGIQIVWNLASSSDASVIVYTRGQWFDLAKTLDVQPLEHITSLVVLRNGQPLQYLD